MASSISIVDVAVISYATDADIVIRPGQASNLTEFSETLRSANYSMGYMKNLGVRLHILMCFFFCKRRYVYFFVNEITSVSADQ